MRTLWLCLLMAGILASGTANAGCAPRTRMLETIGLGRDIRIIFAGVAEEGRSMVELVIDSEDRRTMIQTFPDGTSCTRTNGAD